MNIVTTSSGESLRPGNAAERGALLDNMPVITAAVTQLRFLAQSLLHREPSVTLSPKSLRQIAGNIAMSGVEPTPDDPSLIVHTAITQHLGEE